MLERRTLEEAIQQIILKKLHRRSIYEKRGALLSCEDAGLPVNAKALAFFFCVGFAGMYLALSYAPRGAQPY